MQNYTTKTTKENKRNRGIKDWKIGQILRKRAAQDVRSFLATVENKINSTMGHEPDNNDERG